MEFPPEFRYSVPSAVAGGVVYAALSVALEGEIDYVGGAVFVVAFGLVVTVGLVYADRADREE